VIYLQEAAYYEDQAELEHRLIQSVVWSGRGAGLCPCPWSGPRSQTPLYNYQSEL
jgi:hypothetical protein